MGADDAQTALQQLEQQTASSGSSSGGSLRVSATTLDDVYYPLIAQKGKTAPSGEFNYLNIRLIFRTLINSGSGGAHSITIWEVRAYVLLVVCRACRFF
jgi:hypothetical protein